MYLWSLRLYIILFIISFRLKRMADRFYFFVLCLKLPDAPEVPGKKEAAAREKPRFVKRRKFTDEHVCTHMYISELNNLPGCRTLAHLFERVTGMTISHETV